MSSARDLQRSMKGKYMNQAEEDAFEMKAEYDFSKGRRNPYAARIRASMHVVVIDPELYAVFPSSEAVHEALRLIVRASAKAIKTKAVKQAKAS